MKLAQNISPSLVNNIKTCSLRWCYSQLRVPKIPVYVKEADFGISGHSAIKKYFESISNKPTEKEIRQTAENAFGVVTSMKTKLRRSIDNFVNFEISRLRTWQIYKPKLVEAHLKNTPEEIYRKVNFMPPVGFKSIVDFYGSGILIDWKFGEVDHITDLFQFQLGFMTMQLEWSGNPVNKAYLVSLVSGQILEQPQTTESWVIYNIKNILGQIESNDFRPNKCGLCNYCEYKLRCDLQCQYLCMNG